MKSKKNYYILFIFFSIHFVQNVDGENLFTKASHIDLYADSNKSFSTSVFIPTTQFKISQNEEKINFGLSLTTRKFAKMFPVTIKTGNLSAGGILSNMNNPLLTSSVSPFSDGISTVNGITSSLPSENNFTKPHSSFFEFEYLNKKTNLTNSKITLFFSPDEESLVFSNFNELKLFNNTLQIKNSNCAGFFHYDENSSTSWFPDNLYYHQGNHFCSFYQLSVSLFKFNSTFSLGIYETPFGKLSALYKSENKLNIQNCTLNLSALYNPNTKENKIITSSDKAMKDCLQIRTGIQQKYKTGKAAPIFIKTGFQSFFDLRTSELEYPFKLGVGIQISTSLFSLSLTGTINSVIENKNNCKLIYNFQNAGIQLKSNWYIKNFVPYISISDSINPDSNFTSITNTCKITLGMNYANLNKISTATSLSVTQKNYEIIKNKLSESASCKFTWKSLNIILRFTYDIEM